MFINNTPKICELNQEKCEEEGGNDDKCKEVHSECLKHMAALKQYVYECDE